MDIVVASAGVLLLLEATRRAVGWPMAALAVLFLAYCMLGAYMPEVLSHKGVSLNRLLSHMWLTTEGVYGIALGVSTGAIFVYVLFGTPARPRRRRQLHDAGQLRGAGPPARRAGQGGGGVVGAERHDLRLARSATWSAAASSPSR